MPGYTGATENWNGVSWQETSDLNTARAPIGTLNGTSTAAAAMGGLAPSNTGVTENFSGTSELAKTISTD